MSAGAQSGGLPERAPARWRRFCVASQGTTHRLGESGDTRLSPAVPQPRGLSSGSASSHSSMNAA